MNRRRLLKAVLVTALVLIAFDQAFVRIGVHALLDAPNARKSVSELHEPPPPPGASALRFEVVSPPASVSAWLLDAREPVATVFVLHGIRDSKASMIDTGRQLAEAGFRTLLIDLRGHGGSTGDVLSYGVFDARDLSQIADQLRDKGQLAGRIGVLGFSYGAATAIEWAGRDPRVAAVVAVAPFASLRGIMAHYAELSVPRIGALIPDFAFDRTLKVAGETGQFDPALASPERAIVDAAAHILLIHGRDDHHIAFSNSERLRDRAPERTELIAAEGEDHVSIMSDRRRLIASRGFEWLRRWTGK